MSETEKFRSSRVVGHIKLHPKANEEGEPLRNLLHIETLLQTHTNATAKSVHSLDPDEQRILQSLSDEELEQLIAEVSATVLINNERAVVQHELFQRLALEPAPGFGTLRVLSFFCQKSFRERVLEPYHAEALAEIYEALAENDLTRAAWAKRRMYFYMVWAMVGGVVSWIGGKLSFKIGSGE